MKTNSMKSIKKAINTHLSNILIVTILINSDHESQYKQGTHTYFSIAGSMFYFT